MIVKVQRPVMEGGDPNALRPPPIMVYDEQRRHQTQLHWADLPGWLVNLLEAEPKVYVVAGWRRSGGWSFHRPAPWQPW